MSPESSPLDGLRRAAEELAVEVSSLVPRLVDRSRAQLSIAMSFAERLPCAGWFGIGPEATPPRPDLRVVDGFDEDEDEEEEPAHVGLIPDPAAPKVAAPSAATSAATTAAAKPAPAKKAAAKKQAPAKKAAAKKQAPAKKAAAKKQAPAKKAAAKKAPAKRAAARKAPAKQPAAAPEPLPPLVPDPAAPMAPAARPPGELAVPDYDELAASQVIPRLDSLSPDELESIRVHEAAHRSRRTILSRIAQIQAG